MAMQRFRVAGHSMSPTLQPGEEVVAVDTRPARPGNLVVFEHPHQADLWLIKRLADGKGRVLSDNPADSSHDSTTLGNIPVKTLMPVVGRLDEDSFAEACQLLAAEDEALADSIGRWGVPPFWHRQPGFRTLVLLILEQQVSLESGAAMYRRLNDLVEGVTPESVLAAGPDNLRSIGVTRQKTSYLLDLSARILESQFDLDGLDDLTDDQARKALVEIRGIGLWTADAYMLSAQRRPDMWPVGDRALQVGAGETLGMATAPSESELETLGEPWRPIRAVAARIIWHAYLSTRGRVEPPDPTSAHP